VYQAARRAFKEMGGGSPSQSRQPAMQAGRQAGTQQAGIPAEAHLVSSRACIWWQPKLGS
jgi:hypothetical protein